MSQAARRRRTERARLGKEIYKREIRRKVELNTLGKL